MNRKEKNVERRSSRQPTHLMLTKGRASALAPLALVILTALHQNAPWTSALPLTAGLDGPFPGRKSLDKKCDDFYWSCARNCETSEEKCETLVNSSH